MRAQKKLFCHFERSEAQSEKSLDLTSLSFLLEFERCLDFARNDKLLKNLWMPIRLLETPFGFVFEEFVNRREYDAGTVCANAHVEIDFVV